MSHEPNTRYETTTLAVEIFNAANDIDADDYFETPEQAAQHAINLTMNGNPHFYELLNEIANLHSSKNRDYCGDSQYQGMDNFVAAARHAGRSVRDVFRTLQGIKLARLDALTATGAPPNHESIADTRLDYINYLLLELAFERTYDWIDQVPPN